MLNIVCNKNMRLLIYIEERAILYLFRNIKSISHKNQGSVLYEYNIKYTQIHKIQNKKGALFQSVL